MANPYQTFPILPALQHWVESITIMDCDFSISPLLSVYKYPWSVTNQIYFSLNEEPCWVKSGEQADFAKYPPNLIGGPRLTNYTVNLGRHRRVIGINFRHGVLQRLLGLPMHEIVNNELDASLIWPKDMRELSDKLKNAKNSHIHLQIVQDFLLKKFKEIGSDTAFDLAIAELIKYNGNITIEKIARYAHLSLRQFERRCLQSLGVSPKLFAKLTRFNKAHVRKEIEPKLSWTQIAYEYGYADQMHLIKDFKRFSGYKPSELDAQLSQSIKIAAALNGKI